MRCNAAIAAALALLASSPVWGASAVVAEPSTVIPGQATTLRWYFTGRKVVLSGGRFGKGTVVTGKTRVTDTPRKSTTYAFDVWYVPERGPEPTQQAAGKLAHTRYTVRVAVAPPSTLQTFNHPRGWSIQFLKGWKTDAVPLPDPANNGLVYFQQQDDSVERLAVSVVPAKGLQAADLLRKVETTLPTSYERIEVVSRAESSHRGAATALLTFRGGDMSHPGTRTQSLVMAVVHGSHGYVVSARTAASRFEERRPVLEKMVLSFVPRPVAAAVPGASEPAAR